MIERLLEETGGRYLKKFKVYIAPATEYLSALQRGLQWLEAEEFLSKAAGIFIKPNLTFPEFRPGVTTTPEMLSAAIQVFADLNPRVIVGESDGGYGTFDIEQAFEAFDLHNIARKFGAKVLNLSPRGDDAMYLFYPTGIDHPGSPPVSNRGKFCYRHPAGTQGSLPYRSQPVLQKPMGLYP